MIKDNIRIKFVYKNSFTSDIKMWTKMFINHYPIINNCHFIFDPNDKHYDWLVVYNSIPQKESKNSKIEVHCPRTNTLIITTEPSSITSYEKVYLNQFAYVLTGQENWAISHKGKIYEQPALRWFYNANKELDLNDVINNIPKNKNKIISTVCSNKSQIFTLHQKRLSFIKELKKRLPELNHFGKGINPIKDKSEALNKFKYHIAIENHVANHWWTEKIADAFLGHTLPFYHGAPNINDYFPKNSLIKININNFNQSIEIIRNSIKNNEYEKRKNYISEARNKIIYNYGLFSTLSRLIQQRHGCNEKKENSFIYSRHHLRKNPVNAVNSIIQKSSIFSANLINRLVK